MKRQKSGTAIGTKYAPPFASIFMDAVERDSLRVSIYNLFYGSFILTTYLLYEQMEKKFLNELNNFHPNLNLGIKPQRTMLIF